MHKKVPLFAKQIVISLLILIIHNALNNVHQNNTNHWLVNSVLKIVRGLVLLTMKPHAFVILMLDSNKVAQHVYVKIIMAFLIMVINLNVFYAQNRHILIIIWFVNVVKVVSK